MALEAASAVPQKIVLAEARETRDGPCPVCNSKRGGVDVRTSYRALSFIVITNWTSRSRVSCRVCHYKAVAGNSLLTFLFGWWGFPWGVLATPVQLVRNLIALIPRGAAAEPSERLLDVTRLRLGSEILEGGKGDRQ